MDVHQRPAIPLAAFHQAEGPGDDRLNDRAPVLVKEVDLWVRKGGEGEGGREKGRKKGKKDG